MRVYHISQSLKLGDTLAGDYQRCRDLAEPFVQGLARSEDCFLGMVLNAKYLYAVLDRYRLREWADYAKWATEGSFEFVRRAEFPHCVSRLGCSYFYAELADSRRLYAADWGEETEEERQKVRLFAVDLDDERPDRRDMTVFDTAYAALREGQDLKTVLDCARRYFAGEGSTEPVWELLSDKKAVAIQDLSHLLR